MNQLHSRQTVREDELSIASSFQTRSLYKRIHEILLGVLRKYKLTAEGDTAPQ